MEIIETLVIDGVTWYKGKSVAQQLGYQSTSHTIKVNVDVLNKKRFEDLVETDKSHDYNQRNTIFINEDGLNSLIMKSDKPKSIDVAKEMGIKSEMKYLRKEI